MTGLDHVLDRTVTIAARRETVFRYFTDSERFAAWWGQGSRIEPKPGGAVHIRYPNAVVAGGEVVEITPVERVVFTYGFESGQPIPIGASRVTITLEETARGTVVRLKHELPTPRRATSTSRAGATSSRSSPTSSRRKRTPGSGRSPTASSRSGARPTRRSGRPSSRRSRWRRSPSATPTPAPTGSTT